MTSTHEQPEPLGPSVGGRGLTECVANLRHQAEELLRAGRYQEALARLEEAAGQVDETVDAKTSSLTLLLLARVRRELARHDDAEEAALRAVALLSADKTSPDYARGLAELARIYEARGKYEQASGLARKALELREAALGPPHADVAESLHDLALINDALGHRTEAGRLARRCLEVSREAVGENHVVTMQAYLVVAWVLSGLGKLVEAERSARQAVAIARRVLPPEHPELAGALHRAGAVALSRCRLEEAEPLLEEALRVRQAGLGPAHPFCAGTMEYQAILRGYQGRPEDSERLARQALEITQAALGVDHPYMADSLSNLAQALTQLRRQDEAEQLARQALELVRRVMGERHPAVIRHASELAGHLIARNNRDSANEAEELLRGSLPPASGQDGEGGEQLADVAHLQYQLARCLIFQERLTEARESAQESLRVYRLAYEGEHPALANSLQLLAGLEQALGQPAEAEARHRDAVALLTREMGEAHPWSLEAKRLLAAHLRQRGTPAALAEAEQLLRDAVAQIQNDRDQGRAEDRFAFDEDLASTLHQRGRYEDAEAIYQRLVRERQRALGETHVDVAHTHEQLAFLYEDMGNLAAAEMRHRQALELRQQHPGPESPEYALSLMGLGGLCHRNGRALDAEPLYQQAREIYRTTPGEGSTSHAFSVYQLGLLYRDVGDLSRAEPLLEQARDYYTTIYGEDHLETLRVLRSLAELYSSRGEFGRATRLLHRVLLGLTQAGADQPLEQATTLTDLGLLHYASGDYLAAEPVFEQARQLHEQQGGEASAPHIGTLQRQVVLYRTMADFDRAEALAQQVVDLLERLLGEEHLETAAGRMQLADLLVARASTSTEGPGTLLDRARQLHQQALEGRRGALGRNHPLVAESLTRLAGIHMAQGHLEQAQSLQQQAVATYESVGWGGHPECAVGLRLLAAIVRERGNLDEAESLLRRCLAILSRPGGEFHPILLPSLMQLAELYRGRQDYDRAEETYRQALEIVREGGDNDQARALLLRELGLVQRLANRQAAAEQYLRQALGLERSSRGADRPETLAVQRHLAAVWARMGRQAEALTALEQVAAHEDRILPLVLSLPDVRDRDGWARDLLEGMHQFLTLAVCRLPDREAKVLGQTRLAAVAYDQVLRRKGARTEALARPREAVLAQRVPELEEQVRRWSLLGRQITSRWLAGPGSEGIEEHERLLDLWRQEHEDLGATLRERLTDLPAHQERWGMTCAQVAGALPPRSVLVEWVRLTPSSFDQAGAEDEAANRYLAFVLPAGQPERLRLVDVGPAAPLDELVRDWYTAVDRGDSAALDAVGRALAKALLVPLGEEVERAEGLVFATDSELTRLPFAALPDRQGVPIVERHTVRQVGTARDLVGKPPQEAADGPALVVAYSEQSPTGLGQPSWWRRLLSGGRAEGSEANSEGSRLANLLGGRHLRGPETRSALVAASRPRLLHLATSCFTPGQLGGTPGGRWESPLDRALLSLSSFNDIDRLDSVLSQSAMTGLDLAGSVVVLELTEKGNGPSGTVRFARAARLAGAAWVVTALWPAPERARREFEEAFYKRVLSGQDVAEAVREAQQAVRGKHPNVRAWGGWVVNG